MVLRRVLPVGPVLLVVAACARAGMGSSTAELAETVTKSLCVVTNQGDETKVFKGTLLLPDKPVEGEVVIDKSGVIACAAERCAKAPGYASATVITCHDA